MPDANPAVKDLHMAVRRIKEEFLDDLGADEIGEDLLGALCETMDEAAREITRLEVEIMRLRKKWKSLRESLQHGQDLDKGAEAEEGNQ